MKASVVFLWASVLFTQSVIAMFDNPFTQMSTTVTDIILSKKSFDLLVAHPLPPTVCEVRLRGSWVSDEVVARLAEWACIAKNPLTKLSIHLCENVGGDAFALIARLRGLKALDLTGANITDRSLALIVQSCVHLEDLNLDCCNSLSTQGFASVAQLQHLYEFDASSTQIGDDALCSIIKSNDSIKTLSLSACKAVTLRGWLGVAHLHGLKILDVADTTIDEQALSAITQNCSGIEELCLDECVYIAPSGFASIGQIHHLKKLRVAWTRMGDASLMAIAMGCPALQYLSVVDCFLLSPGAFTHLYFCKQLKTLFADGCHLDDGSLLAITKDLPLEGLMLGGEHACITANGWASIALLHNLKHACMCDATIEGQEVQGIVRACQKLEKIQLLGCHRLVPELRKSFTLPGQTKFLLGMLQASN